MTFNVAAAIRLDFGSLELFARAYNEAERTLLTRAKEAIIINYVPDLEKRLPSGFSIARDEIKFYGTNNTDESGRRVPTHYKLSISLRKDKMRIPDSEVKAINNQFSDELAKTAAIYGLAEIELHGEKPGLF